MAQHRVDGVVYDVALFTNLSQDHLDFHGSMEDYFAAKARLFDGRCPTATNAADAYGSRLDATVRYGDPSAAIRADDLRLEPGGSWFRLVTPAGEVPVQTRLRGAFNVANVLAAASLAHLMDVPLEAIAAGIASVSGVPGRLEPVEAGQPFTVLVDYAHTPDALATVLATARGITRGRLIVVFGCGGDRDRGKRGPMGRVVNELADLAIVTSDNPRGEDPLAIIGDVLAGMEPVLAERLVEPDRRRAISQAVSRARSGDVVLIAGKGHETTQTIGDRVVEFDDRQVALELLR